MTITEWTWIIVGVTFALYIGIAFYTKAKSTGEFYIAGKSVHPLANGMATGADWSPQEDYSEHPCSSP